MTHKLQNNYAKEILTVLRKILGPTTDFLTWESSKRTQNSQGNRLLEGTAKPCEHQDPEKKEQ